MRPPLRIERFLARYLRSEKSVVHRHSDRTVKKQLKDPEFPVLISFPRTGSHYLRLLMELYFEVPSLPRIFHYKKVRSFTCCHMHDLIPPDRPAGIERERVIHLYRDPAPTVHSVMRYYDDDLEDPERVEHWSTVYREHLKKWLLDEDFTREKLLIRYEQLLQDPVPVFRELNGFFDADRDPKEVERIAEGVQKEDVKARTRDNPSIIGEENERKKERNAFLERFEERIQDRVFGAEPRLRDLYGMNETPGSWP